MSIINKVAGWLANISTYDATTGAITDLSVSGNVTGSALKAGPSGIVVSGNNITSASTPILIDPLNDGTPAGNVIIKGSMEVTGNLTYNDISTAITSNLVWVAADDANTALTASGGGLAVGPNAAPYATWLYNSVSNAWVSNINANVAGNVTAAAFYGDGGHLSNISANAIAGGTFGNANLANIGANAVSTTGNISAAYFIGNGSALTGLPAGYGNANLADIGANAVSTTGNISGNYFIGNGALLTGITAGSNYGNANLANIGSNAIGTTGNVTAAYHIGDGSLLTGTPTSVAYLNVSSNSTVAAAIAAASTPDVRGKLFVITNTGTSIVTLTGTFTGYTAFPLVASASAISIPIGGVAEISTITPGTTYQITTISNWSGTNNNVFRIYPTATNGPASDSVIAWAGVDFDPLGYWNTATNKYQPKIAGYYQITVQISTSVSGQNITALIQKNGTQIAYGVSAAGSGGWQTAIVTSTIYLNGTTDYLQFGGRTNGKVYAVSVAPSTFVTGCLLTASTTIAGSNAAFKAVNSGTQVVTTTPAQVTALATDIDPNGWWDGTNKRFTPTIAGYYRVVGRVGPAIANSWVTTFLYKNGVQVAVTPVPTPTGGASNATGEVSTILYFNGSTDYVELWASSTGLTIGTQPQYTAPVCELSGELIGGINVAPQVAPSNAVFKAIVASGVTQTISTPSSPTKVTIWTADIDPNTWWSAGNTKLTPTMAGYYRVIVRLGPFSVNNWTIGYVYKNGAKVATSDQYMSSGNNGIVEVSSLIYMNGQTDYLEAWIEVGAAGSIGYSAAFVNACEFSAELIGGMSISAPPVNAATNAVGKVNNPGGFSVATSTNTKVSLSLGTGAFDPNNWWDGTNNRWKPTLAGYYNVVAQVGMNATAAVGYTQVSIAKNGASVCSNLVENAQAGGLPFVNTHDVVYMNGTTDYLEMMVYQTSGTTQTTYNISAYNYFSLSLVGGTGATVLPPPATVVSYNSTVATALADNTAFSTNAAAPTTVLTYNLPTAGTWEIHSQISYRMSDAQGNSIYMALYDAAGVMVPGTQAMITWTPSTGWRGTDDRQYLVTTTGASSYTVRVWASSTGGAVMQNSTYGYTNGYYKQIGAVGLTSAVGTTPTWTSAGAIVPGATTTAPTFGTTTKNNMSYRQLGIKEWEVMMTVAVTSAGTAGNGDYLFTLPNGLSFDSTLPWQSIYNGSVGGTGGSLMQYALPSCVGTFNSGASTWAACYIVPYDATRFRILYHEAAVLISWWNSSHYALNNAFTLNMTFRFQST